MMLLPPIKSSTCIKTLLILLLSITLLFVTSITRVMYGRVDMDENDEQVIITTWIKHSSNSNNMIMVTMYDGSSRFKIFAETSLRDKIQYAKRHDYTFMVVPNTLDSTRHIVWSKIKILHYLSKLQKYTFILWIDFDTLIQHAENTPMQVFDVENTAYVNTQLWLVGDLKPSTINAGLMLIKSGEWASQLFQTIYEDHWHKEIFWGILGKERNREQDALQEVISVASHNVVVRIFPYGLIWTLDDDKNKDAWVIHYCNCIDGRCGDEFIRDANTLFERQYRQT
jgi:hypothetical protein